MVTKKTSKKVTKKVVETPAKKDNSAAVLALRKKTIIFFGVVVVFVILDLLLKNLVLKGISELIYFVFAILSLVYSIKLVKKKDYKLGIPILILSAIVVLFILLMFVVGLIIGVMMSMQTGTTPPI